MPSTGIVYRGGSNERASKCPGQVMIHQLSPNPQQIEQLASIADSIPALISFVDRDLRYRYCNRSYSEWFGLAHEQIMGKPMSEVLGPEAMHALQPHLQRALGGEVADFEAEASYKRGGKRWIHAIYTPHRNPEGVVVGLAVLVTDISERKRLELAVRRKRERLSLALTAGSMGAFELNLCDDMLSWSPEIYAVFGVQASTFKPTREAFTALIHPDDRDAWWRGLEQSITTKQLFVHEFRILRPDGALRWITHRGQTEYDADGTAVCHFGVAIDVTSGKNAADEIKRSEARLNAVLAHLREGVIILAAGPTPIYWNPSALRIHGHPTIEECTRPIDQFQRIFELWTSDGTRRLEHDEWPIQRIMRGESMENVELLLKRPDRDVDRIVLCSGKIVETSTGEELIYLSLLDLTAQRQAEAALRESEERHRQLAEQLSEANRRKDEFLAMLAHELRNPLAPIQTAAHVLQRFVSTDPKIQRLSDVITRQVTHMARLIDDLLDVSRITRGKIMLRFEPVDLARVLETVVDDHRSSIESSGLRLALRLPDEAVIVQGDKTRLVQVFGNLLQNAHKFTPKGGRIDVLIQCEHDEAVVQMTDTGIGMSPELIGRIFEPFVQATTSLDRSKGGLGLGLALAKGIIQLHTGHISAYSRGEGTGSTFEVKLKRIHNHAAATVPDENDEMNRGGYSERISGQDRPH